MHNFAFVATIETKTTKHAQIWNKKYCTTWTSADTFARGKNGAWTGMAHMGRAALIELVKEHGEVKVAPCYPQYFPKFPKFLAGLPKQVEGPKVGRKFVLESGAAAFIAYLAGSPSVIFSAHGSRWIKKSPKSIARPRKKTRYFLCLRGKYVRESAPNLLARL